jgi:2-dehydro-3-deoxyphosphooctonate aldolase (KDO 8-P synthase)
MSWTFGKAPLLIAGPCVVESDDVMVRVAEELVPDSDQVEPAGVLQGEFRQGESEPAQPRPGVRAGDGITRLERVRDSTGLPLLTDVHEPEQARAAADVVDALQIPAFLCRQTDLLLAAGRQVFPST